jgi:predicted nucleic acid-binding protein
MQKVCLDTGVVSLIFCKDPPDRTKIQKIFTGSLENQYEIYILSPIFSELFYHLCVINGKFEARTKILSLKKNYPINVVDISEDIFLYAGELKCKYRNLVSYIDCFCIAFCSLYKIEFHTTEKKIKKIPFEVQNCFKLISYCWE